MSVLGATLILGIVVVLLIKWKLVKAFVAIVCILFGLVLAVTPIGGVVINVVTAVGDFTATQIGRL